jgi:hypothetical protein
MPTCLLKVLASLLLGASLACNSQPVSRMVRRSEADFIMVKNEYSLVLLRRQFMEGLFGADWASQQLFYGYNRALDDQGREVQVTTYLSPMAKGHAMLMLSGDSWELVLCPIYSLDTHQQALLEINLRDGLVKLDGPVSLREGDPHVSPEGQLFF